MSRRTATWALGALLGIVLTAAITWATSRLTAQHIGLSSEPLSAGRRLVPRAAPQPRKQVQATSTTTTTTLRHTVSVSRSGAHATSSSTIVTTSILTTAHRSAPGGEGDDSHAQGGGQGHGSQRPAGSGPDD